MTMTQDEIFREVRKIINDSPEWVDRNPLFVYEVKVNIINKINQLERKLKDQSKPVEMVQCRTCHGIYSNDHDWYDEESSVCRHCAPNCPSE
jgi:hypothetical protein